MAGIPQIKIVFDRRKKASAVNPGTMEIEVSYNRERVRLLHRHSRTQVAV